MKTKTKKVFLLFYIYLIPFPFLQIMGQNKPVDKTDQVALHRSYEFNIASKINDVTYPIYVALPGSYFSSEKKYPVVYMLDAYSSFGIMTQMARLLAYNKEIPEVIVVGISSEGGSKEFNYNRARDFTPTIIPSDKLPEEFKSAFPVSGGAEKFLAFIKEELIPQVETRYRINTDDRTIEGHSLGGLFVFYSLFKEPGLFKRYVAVSPALFWDNEFLLKQEEIFSDKQKVLTSIIYTTVGSLENEIFKSPWNKIIENLKSRSYKGMKIKAEVAEGETHYSIIPYIVTHGLKFVFAENTK